MGSRPRHRRGKRGGVKHKQRELDRARRMAQAEAAKAARPTAVKALRARLAKLTPQQAA